MRKLREPTDKDTSKDIEWVCNSLGFVTARDQGQTAFKILRALVKSAKKGVGMTSEELTKVVEPTIGSVIYHLKKLMKSGLVIKIGSIYELRMNSLLSTIEEIQKEIDFAVEDIKSIAKDIDHAIGLEHREAVEES